MGKPPSFSPELSPRTFKHLSTHDVRTRLLTGGNTADMARIVVMGSGRQMSTNRPRWRPRLAIVAKATAAAVVRALVPANRG